MRGLILMSFIPFSILFSFSTLADPVDPSDLVKVNTNNRANCVDYFIYKGATYCSTTSQNSRPVNPNIQKYETLNIAFDERPWQLAWGKQTALLSTVEYVPNGDAVDNWKELVTSQYFPDIQKKASPKEFANMIIQSLKNSGYRPIVTFLQESPERVLFEFRIESPKNQIQDELEMITKDDHGMYVLHYVVKKADMGAETRAKWQRNLMDTDIKK